MHMVSGLHSTQSLALTGSQHGHCCQPCNILMPPGTYWDNTGGCLRGAWVSGNLKGLGQYDQPHYHFEGQFAKGLPAGRARGLWQGLLWLGNTHPLSI